MEGDTLSFLRRLHSAWQFLKYMPYLEYADHEDFWREEDSRAVQHFWRSPTGQKLRARCVNLTTRLAVNSTHAATDHLFHAGWARGVAATFAWLDGHLPNDEIPVLPQDEKQEMTAEELIEKYAA